MSRTERALLTALVLAAAGAVSFAKAPGSADVMQPVDTTAGTWTDPKKLFQVNLSKPVSIQVENQPAELAFSQVGAALGIEWGFMPGVDTSRPVTLLRVASGRDVIQALGIAAQVRFEATGPTQVRVFPAREARKAPKSGAPPPVKRN